MNNIQKQSGFTLIELCIAMVIVGLFVAAAVQAYVVYDQKLKAERMNTLMLTVDDAIEDFYAAYERLPCPAPVNGSTAGNGFNQEDCSGGHGIIEVAGTNGGRVLIGKYPAATLGLDSTKMKDVYGNYLTYAVTKEAAIDGGEVPGQINLIEEGIDQNASSLTAGQVIIINDHTDVQYVVISQGETGVGAFAFDGSITEACDGTQKETENCDYNDATFISSVRSDVISSDEFYDDRVIFKNKFTKSTAGLPNVVSPAILGEDWTVSKPINHPTSHRLKAFEIEAKSSGFLELTRRVEHRSGSESELDAITHIGSYGIVPVEKGQKLYFDPYKRGGKYGSTSIKDLNTNQTIFQKNFLSSYPTEEIIPETPSLIFTGVSSSGEPVGNRGMTDPNHFMLNGRISSNVHGFKFWKTE